MNYYFFWGGVCSNWARSKFTIDDVEYNCVEQYMMAKKAETFNDEDIQKRIMSSDNPRNQKALGRKVKGFTDEKWDKVKYQIVVDGCYAKFTQNDAFKEYLMSLGDKHIVEASPYDKVWGIGLAPDDPKRHDKSNWRGQNLLGEALMLVRSSIISGIKPTTTKETNYE